MAIANYCSEKSKSEKQSFDNFSLKTSRETQEVAENVTVCNRCHTVAYTCEVVYFYYQATGAVDGSLSVIDFCYNVTF